MDAPPLDSPPPLPEALEARLDPRAAAWLRAALDEAARGGAAGAGFGRAWAAAGRKLGREALALPAAPGWAADEAGRALLLAAALQATPEAAHVATVAELYRTGEERERQALVRALAHLPGPARFADLAAEAVRSNMQSVFEALACDNPYPARFMSDGAFGQLVLKALFVGVPLARVTGLDGRRTPELSRMVAAFASERRAAGRTVPADVQMILRDPESLGG